MHASRLDHKQPQPAPTILDLRRRSSVSSPPSSPSSLHSDASDKDTTATSTPEEDAPSDWLKTEVVKGLIGTGEVTLPGDTDEDREFAYRRTVPTMTLYSQRGLEIYEDITNTKVRFFSPLFFEPNVDSRYDPIPLSLPFHTFLYPTARLTHALSGLLPLQGREGDPRNVL